MPVGDVLARQRRKALTAVGVLASVGVLVAVWLVRPDQGRWWAPKPGQAWQWQLTTPVDQSVDVPVYDIDGLENSAEVVRALHQRGRRVICSVVVGSAEDFRPDYGAFPREVTGDPPATGGFGP